MDNYYEQINYQRLYGKRRLSGKNGFGDLLDKDKVVENTIAAVMGNNEKKMDIQKKDIQEDAQSLVSGIIKDFSTVDDKKAASADINKWRLSVVNKNWRC